MSKAAAVCATLCLIGVAATFGDNGCLNLLSDMCHCDEVTVNCTNAGFKTTDIFLQISDTNFPHLDTLVLTGNYFPELETNLFGPGSTHKLLSKLDLSNNSIKTVHAGAFRDLPKLEELALNDNEIEVDDMKRLRLFDRLKSLKILQLSRAFDKHADVSNVSDALTVIFGPKSELEQLEYLHLQGNNLQRLEDSVFCEMPVLEYLYLQNNSLTAFAPRPHCIVNLVELHLENNKIARYSKKNVERLNDAEHLSKIFLAGNPIDCSCEQNEFIKWAKTSESVRDRNATFCKTSYPDKYKNRPLTEVDADSLKCQSDGSGYMHGVYVICGVAIVGLGVLLFCLLYTNRSLLCARRKRGLLMTSSGYEILNKEPEVKAEMV